LRKELTSKKLTEDEKWMQNAKLKHQHLINISNTLKMQNLDNSILSHARMQDQPQDIDDQSPIDLRPVSARKQKIPKKPKPRKRSLKIFRSLLLNSEEEIKVKISNKAAQILVSNLKDIDRLLDE
jgi:hypothetical protein